MDGVLRCIYPRSTYTLEEELNYVLRVGRPRLLLRRFGIVALKCRCWLVRGRAVVVIKKDYQMDSGGEVCAY